MTVSDRDILTSAKSLIDKRGLKGASQYCASRIQSLRDLGDDEGVRVWGRIRAALLDLSDLKLPGDRER